MAGAGYKLFNTGDVLTAAQVNTYLQEQVVMVFDDAAARTTALSGVLSEGMVSYLKDTDSVEKYDGSAWVSLGGSASPLTTKGDLYTYSTTDARLAVGSNGDTLVADSSSSTGLRWQPSVTAGKNLIINGAMDIWQRGTSITTSGAYTADRWAQVSGVSATFSRSTDVPSNSGFTYSMSMAGVGSNINQRIESLQAAAVAGQTVTVSFWYKSTVGTDVLNFQIWYATAADNFAGLTQIGSTQTINTPSTSWTRVSYTFTNISANAINGLSIYIYRGNNATSTTLVTGVQLELGSVATAFSRAAGTIQGELAACQRYYEKSYALDVAPGTAGASSPMIPGFSMPVAAASTTGYILAQVRWKVEKRATPTVTVYDMAGTSGVVTASNPGSSDTNGNSCYASSFTTSGGQIGRDGVGGTRTATNSFIYHYVASAEL